MSKRPREWKGGPEYRRADAGVYRRESGGAVTETGRVTAASMSRREVVNETVSGASAATVW